MATDSHAFRDERARAVLRAAVEWYIDSAAPVASRTLTRGGLSWSPATIRSVMNRLEEEGLLEQPHTSAGRIPTTLGYRAYVDDLMASMAVRVAEDAVLRRVGAVEGFEPGPRRILDALVTGSGLPGFVLSAKAAPEVHRHMELVRLRRREVLVILATRAGRVHHRVLRLDVDVSQAELERFQNYLNGRFEGMSLSAVRRDVREELAHPDKQYASLRTRALQLTRQALEDEEPTDVEFVVAGQHRLLDAPEFTEGAAARPVLEAFEHRDTWRTLLDAMIEDDGVRIFIGREIPVGGLELCSMACALIRGSDARLDAIGIVGPTRLPYATVIALVDRLRRDLEGRDEEEACA